MSATAVHRLRDDLDRSRAPQLGPAPSIRTGTMQRSNAIRCSDCGRQVALADLQDHACSPAMSATPTLGSTRPLREGEKSKPAMQIKMPRTGAFEKSPLHSPSLSPGFPRSPATASSGSASSPGLPPMQSMTQSPSGRQLPFFERWAKTPFGSSGSVSSASTGATSVSGREDAFKYDDYMTRDPPPASMPMPASTSSRSLSRSKSSGSDGRGGTTPVPRSQTDVSLASSAGRMNIGASMLNGHSRSNTSSSSGSLGFSTSAYADTRTSPPAPMRRPRTSEGRQGASAVPPTSKHGLGVSSGMTRSTSAQSGLTRSGPSARLDDLLSSLDESNIHDRDSVASTHRVDSYYGSNSQPAALCLACNAAPATSSGDLCAPCYKIRYLLKCRKCKLPIESRAVGSGDGKVKGKFHAHCFSCFACNAPFPSGEFYVFDERPYCSQHYHALAGSLCTNCDRGIEGSCVSLNESGRKYHPSCFSCSHAGCSILLPEEHYLLDGLPYCERHAAKRDAANRAAGAAGGAGAKRSEKRRTVVAPLARRR